MKPGPKPLKYKVCPSCHIKKPRSEYYKKAETISRFCKPCSLADSRLRAPLYYGKYRDYQNEWRRQRYKQSAEYRELVSQQKKSLYYAKQDELNAKRRERWSNDPYDPARLHYRRKDVKDRTPPWADKKRILEVYAKCSDGYHVDHIIPLKGLIDGRPVSGLHVHENLQYLTEAQNRKKYNRVSENDIAVVC